MLCLVSTERRSPASLVTQDKFMSAVRKTVKHLRFAQRTALPPEAGQPISTAAGAARAPDAVSAWPSAPRLALLHPERRSYPGLELSNPVEVKIRINSNTKSHVFLEMITIFASLQNIFCRNSANTSFEIINMMTLYDFQRFVKSDRCSSNSVS